MTKSFVTVLLALFVLSSMSLLGQDKSSRTKAPMKTEPINFLQLQTELGTDVPNFNENYVAVDTMSNTFGPASATLNPVVFDPYSNVVAVVHRGNANTYAQGSGELWWNTSQDMGATWPRSLTSVQNNITSTILARYPSMTIFNPTHSGTFGNLWGAFSWPELDVSFAFLGYGVTLGMEISAFAEIDFDPPLYSSNVPTFADDDYIYWLTDNQDNNAFRLFRTQDYSVVEKIDPPTWGDATWTNGAITMGAVAYNGVLYHAVSGSFVDVIGFGGWEVGYSKSTDNGSTWSQWYVPDWHTLPGLEDYEELWDWKKDDGFVSYAGDIQVDKDGLVHMLIGLTNLADSSDERGYNAIIEIFETAFNLWDYKILAEGDEAHDLSLYETANDGAGNAQDPAVGQNGPSFMIATNLERDFLMAQWVIAPYSATEDSIPCDLWYSTRALTDAAWSEEINMTETTLMNEDGAHLAPYLASVTTGDATEYYGFSMFWYEAGNTGTLVNSLNPAVVYIAAVNVGSTVGVEGDVSSVADYSLAQNYPNPFNPNTSISYSLAERSAVSLKVYDILGNEVVTLVNTTQGIGAYEVNFNAANLASGLYIYTLKAGSFTSTKKMMLLK
ncbi:T9SS type A sorting domain-containing protein [Bacteroidota bacterium]